jgi:hypothetical protein
MFNSKMPRHIEKCTVFFMLYEILLFITIATATRKLLQEADWY